MTPGRLVESHPEAERLTRRWPRGDPEARRRARGTSDRRLAKRGARDRGFAIVGSVIATIYTENTDRALVGFAGMSVLLAVFALLVTRPRRTTQRRVDEAQLESAKHLARIAELLERQQDAPTVTTQQAKPRHATTRIVALLLVALALAHLRR